MSLNSHTLIQLLDQEAGITEISMLIDKIAKACNLWSNIPQGTRNVTQKIIIYTADAQAVPRKFEGSIISIVHWDIPTKQHKGNIAWILDDTTLHINIF